jgi:hypothetical protein
MEAKPKINVVKKPKGAEFDSRIMHGFFPHVVKEGSLHSCLIMRTSHFLIIFSLTFVGSF